MTKEIYSKKLLPSILVIFLILVYSVFAEEEIRAAIDIGSGTMKLKVAVVDTTNNKIKEVLLDKSVPVPFQNYLEKSPNNSFDNTIRQKGIQALKELKAAANTYHPEKIIAIATSAFRHAANSKDYTEEIKAETGIDVLVISQEQESFLAFNAAIAQSELSSDQIVVWDIGGGSYQFITLNDKMDYVIENGKIASIAFKNYIIEKIQGKNKELAHSPNPISYREMKKALEYAENIAHQTQPAIKEKILKKNVCVYCIVSVGSLFGGLQKGLFQQQDVISREELQNGILELIGKTDKDIPDKDYADVAVSNAIFILGFMNALDIRQIYIVPINNADGALTFSEYWEKAYSER